MLFLLCYVVLLCSQAAGHTLFFTACDENMIKPDRFDICVWVWPWGRGGRSAHAANHPASEGRKVSVMPLKSELITCKPCQGSS